MMDDTSDPGTRSFRLRTTATLLARRVRSTPVAASIVLITLVAGVLWRPIFGSAGALLGAVGTGYEPLTQNGHWWSPITAVFFAKNTVELVVVLLIGAVLLTISEQLMGSWRTVVAFVVTTYLGTLAGVGLQVLGSGRGELWSRSVVELVVLDPLTAIGGTVMVASGFASVLWRRRIRSLTILVALVFLLYSGQPSDLYRLLAVLVGLVLGVVLRPEKRVLRWVRSSHHEVRVLMASVVVVAAVGPMIALLSSTRFGPLAPIALLLGNDVPDLGKGLDRCQALNVTRQCLQELTLERISSPGAVLISIIPLATLLIASYGLVKGRRFALFVAAAVNGLLGLLTVIYFGFLPVSGLPYVVNRPGSNYWEATLALSLSMVLPFAISIGLLLLRRHFPVVASKRMVTRYVVTIVTAAIGLATVYVTVGWLFRDIAFNRVVTFGELLSDVPERFIPVAFLRHETISFLPSSWLWQMLYDGIGLLFWVVVVIAAIGPTLDSQAREDPGAAERVRTLLRSGGGDSLSFMATWPGNSYWFAPDGVQAVAYRVVNGTALTIGGPFGQSGRQDLAIEGFARYCDDNGWVPVLYSVDASLEQTFAAMGWQTMVVAEETVIRPSGWVTTGKKWQDVRSSINRAERAGVSARWTSHSALSLGLANQISIISEQWVADKDLPEMGFTLGGLAELRDPAVRLMIAVDVDDRIEGVTSWLPSYRNGVVIGWTLDFMRRRPDGINGVMEFLIAESAMRMRDDGVEFMSLSAAPLAHTASAPIEGASGMDQLLGYLSTSLEPVYGFRSLLRFKRKFQPELRPMLMAYPDRTALPLIGIALARAYLPTLTVRQASTLLRGKD
jgi:phosphatidylglycerol lysyltransferase